MEAAVCGRPFFYATKRHCLPLVSSPRTPQRIQDSSSSSRAPSFRCNNKAKATDAARGLPLPTSLPTSRRPARIASSPQASSEAKEVVGRSNSVRAHGGSPARLTYGPATMAPKEDNNHQQLRALAARAVTDSLRAAASRSSAVDRAARFRDCVRSLEAEKAKMEVFRRELPISVHLVADAIEWLKEELAQAQHRRQPTQDLFAPAADAAAPASAKDGDVKAEGEADADDKRSWMSSAQLWSCGSHDDSTANTNGVAAATAAQNKVSTTFMPTLATLPTTLARSPPDEDAACKPGATPVPDLTLSSPPSAAAAAAPSATSSAVTDAFAGAQRQHHHQQQQAQQQRKARRCWSPELHRRFVAALQRLGGAQVATPKQIREMMKVDGLTNDEVKSHLQKYRLHTRRVPTDGGGDQHAGGLWSSSAVPEQQQHATSQHSTSQSGSPQGPLQLTATVSSRAMSATAGDSCDGGDEAEGGGGGRSESYGWELQQQQQHGTKASPSF